VSAQQEQRMVKSEHGSPHTNTASTPGRSMGALVPQDIANFPTNYNFMQNVDRLTGLPEHDQPLFSAGLSTSVDWSHYDGLDFNNTDFGAASSFSQAASFNGFDFSGAEQPALTTTSTSGEISEAEDFPVYDATMSRPSLVNSRYGSDFDTSDVGGEMDGYRLSTASSYVGLSHAQMQAGNDVFPTDIDSFLKTASHSPVDDMPNHGLTDFDDPNTFLPLTTEEENDSFWLNEYHTNISMNPPQIEPYVENHWAQ